MNVLHVYKDVAPTILGGIERHIDDLRQSMPAVRSDVLVCSRTRRTLRLTTPYGAEVRVGEIGRVLSAPLAPTYPLELRRFRPDLLHVHMPNPTGEVSALMARRDIPMIAAHHADIVRQRALRPLYGPLIDRVFRRASAIVAGSQATAEQSEALAAHRDKVHVIPYGVDTDRFDPRLVSPEKVAEVRARFGSPLVVATGRLVYYKGFENLIEAARILKLPVAIVGTGPLEADLRRHASSVPGVTLTGGVSEADLLALLAAADCFVLASTSRAESFGIATLEAQAMATPAVVTDVGTGTTDTIEPGVTGVVVAPRDVDALVEGINRVLGDSEARERMAGAARRRAVEHFSMQSIGARYLRLYETVTDLPGGTPTVPDRPQPRGSAGRRAGES
jgi:rhamnosyl/mannosyltransferase